MFVWMKKRLRFKLLEGNDVTGASQETSAKPHTYLKIDKHDDARGKKASMIKGHKRMGVHNQKATFPGEVSEDPVERGRCLTKELRHLYLVIFMFLFSACMCLH